MALHVKALVPTAHAAREVLGERLLGGVETRLASCLRALGRRVEAVYLCTGSARLDPVSSVSSHSLENDFS